MFYDDEKTTELELPGKTVPAPPPPPPAPPRPATNIVHVDFPASARLRKPMRRDDAASPEPAPVVHMARQHWASRVELRTSWVLRLLAVVVVLALSFLIL